MSLLERVFYFHQEIERGRYPNANSIATAFEVSIATAKRDIAYLRDRLLAPLVYESSRHGYRYGEGQFQLPFQNGPRIILMLAMLSKLAAEAGLGSLDEVRQLKERLATLVSADQGDLLDAIAFSWIEVEEPDHQVFTTVIDALLQPRHLLLAYRGVGGTRGDREVIPQRLLHYQGSWYLFAYCLLREDQRLFHLARISRAELGETTSPAELANTGSLKNASFGIFQAVPCYTASILFTATAAELVRNQHWHHDQRLEETGEGVVLHLPVGDDREILMKILQYGAMAKVISPPSLIQRVQRELSAMTQQYSQAQVAPDGGSSGSD
jgi:predicted DNA-binding transcriptional regulator YafY